MSNLTELELPDDDFENVAVIQAVKVTPKQTDITSYLIEKDGILSLPEKIVYLKVVDKPKWHEKTGIEDFDRGAIIECPVVKNMYATGLTEKERIFLEGLTGFKLHNHFSISETHSFYGKLTGKLQLPNRTIMLDLSKPLDYIKFKFAPNHMLIAADIDEIEDGSNAVATHYVFNEDTEDNKILNSAIKKGEAEEYFAKLTPKERRALYTYLTKENVDNFSQEMISAKLMKYRDENIDKFLEVSKIDKKYVFCYHLINTGINKQIINLGTEGIKYQDTFLGIDIETATEFIYRPENQSTQLRILEHIKAKFA